MKELKAEILKVDTLTSYTKKSMYKLFSNYYEKVSFSLFSKDLINKHYIIALYDLNQKIRGFSTIEICSFTYENETINAIFSGDTIINNKYWGNRALPYAFGYFAGKLKAINPNKKLFWFLIAKGHRTYRFLPAYAKSYFPNIEENNYLNLKEILVSLAKNKFPNNYNLEKNLIQYNESQGQLAIKWEGEKEKTLKNKYSKYFYELNPNYQMGEELACIAELKKTNLKSTVLRGFTNGTSCTLGDDFKIS